MKTSHLSQNANCIVPLFYGRIALYATKQELIIKFAGHDTTCLTTVNGLNYLEIRIEDISLSCFLNPDEVCYTCWIYFDDLQEPEACIQFYNRYFLSSETHKNYWQAANNETIELVKEKERYFLVIG